MMKGCCEATADLQGNTSKTQERIILHAGGYLRSSLQMPDTMQLTDL